MREAFEGRAEVVSPDKLWGIFGGQISGMSARLPAYVFAVFVQK